MAQNKTPLQEIYIQLGDDKSTVFQATSQKVVITGNKIAKVRKNQQVIQALRSGLIKEVSEDAYKRANPSESKPNPAPSKPSTTSKTSTSSGASKEDEGKRK